MTEIREYRDHDGGALAAPARFVIGALILALLPVVYLHLRFAGVLDPARDTVSDYVSVPGGAAPLACAVLAIAAATAALAFALVRSGLSRPGPVCACLLAGCLGLLGSVVFPTNALGSALTDSAVAHRYTAGVFFLAVPLAGFLVYLRRRTGGPLLLAVVGLGALFLLSHVPLLFPAAPGAGLVAAAVPRGLAERALLGAELVLLTGMARTCLVRTPAGAVRR